MISQYCHHTFDIMILNYSIPKISICICFLLNFSSVIFIIGVAIVQSEPRLLKPALSYFLILVSAQLSQVIKDSIDPSKLRSCCGLKISGKYYFIKLIIHTLYMTCLSAYSGFTVVSNHFSFIAEITNKNYCNSYHEI